MKWKKEKFSLGGHSKKKDKDGSSKTKDPSTSSSGSSKRLRGRRAQSEPTTPTPPTGPGLGTLRLGTLRGDSSAPICTPTPRAKRQLISDLLEPDDDGEDKDDNSSAMSASTALRGIISKKNSSGKNFDKEAGRGESFSSYTAEEKVAFACHLNQFLMGDPFLKHLLPLDAGGADLFTKFSDGVLMCRLVCLAIPGSVADAKINVPTDGEPLGLYKSTENLNAALTAAEAAGLQVVNIGAADIIDGRPASILGLSWQLIRVHLLAQINLKGCPDLIHLMEEGEEKEDFFKLPVEEILLRWFNHHLRWAGSERRISNFAEDLADGRCYVTLVKELNDNFRGEESEFPEEDEKRAQFRRACLVISGAEGIGLAPLIRPRHINGKANLYNIAFVAQLLNRRPRIHRESLHLQASVTMQAWYRMVNVVRRTAPIIAERRASATTMSRACRRWLDLRKRQRAATVLQAWRRGGAGRREASRRRFDVGQEAAAKAQAAALHAAEVARAAAAATAEAERVAAAEEAEAERVAAAEAAAKVAVIELEKQTRAATELQAWARGIGTRRAVSTVLEQRGLPILAAEQRRRDSWSGSLKQQQAGGSVSARTSISSSIRYSISEDAASTESSSSPVATSVANSSSSGKGTASAAEISLGWFDKVFSGISFGGGVDTAKTRGSNTSKRKEAAAAMVLQRWRRRVVQRRVEAMRAHEVAAHRRWAVRTLHKAYADKWRFNVAARKERRLKWEEESRRKRDGKGKLGWFAGFWAEIVSGLARKSEGLDSDEEDESFGKRRAARRKALEEAIEDGDCCDAAGQGVLASEIDGWKSSYVAALVLGSPGQGVAQEERAQELSKVGVDEYAWSSPETVLSPARCVAMMSVLFTVVYESVIAHAATVAA